MQGKNKLGLACMLFRDVPCVLIAAKTNTFRMTQVVSVSPFRLCDPRNYVD